MKLRHLLYLLFALPLMCSCNTEDDIDEIFVSGPWNVVNYFGKANWEKENGEPVYKGDKEGIEALKIISNFSITFNEDGTFIGMMQNNSTFNGTWQANGKDRRIDLHIQGSPNTSTRYNREFIDHLKNAYYYKGDSNVLLLAPEGKKTYIQLRHK